MRQRALQEAMGRQPSPEAATEIPVHRLPARVLGADRLDDERLHQSAHQGERVVLRRAL